MSIFGGGSQSGQIRYALIFDTAQAQQSIGTFKNSLTQMGSTTTTAGRNVQMMGTQFQTSGRNINTAGTQIVSNLKRIDQSSISTGANVAKLGNSFNATLNPIKTSGNALNQFQQTTQTAGERINKLGGFFKTNAINVGALSIGIAGLDDQFLQLHKAQVANERAMLMKEKVDQRVAKLQEALNKMVRAGKEGTTDYNLKLRDLALAQEQAGIASERAEVTQENLNEATEDFAVGILPNFTLVGISAVNMIKEMGINSTTLKTGISKLGDTFSGFTGKLTLANGALSNMGMLLAGGLGAAAAIAIIQTVTTQIDKFYAKIKATPRSGGSILDAIFDWKKFAQEAKAGEAELDEVLARTGASLGELAARPDEVGKRFLEMGGKIDSTGKIALTAKERFIDLGLGIYGAGKSSLQYIEWAKNMLVVGDSQIKVLKYLTDSGIKGEAALKILAFAVKDSIPIINQQSSAIQSNTGYVVTSATEIANLEKNMTTLNDTTDGYIAGLHASSAQTQLALTNRQELTQSVEDENQNLIKIAKQYGATMTQLSGLNSTEKDGIVNIENKNIALKTLIDTLKAQAKAYTTLREILPDYNTNLHNSSLQTTNAVAKAKQYAGTITDFNAKLVEHAQQLNVDTNVINANTAATGDSSEMIIKKNQNLRVAIHEHKGTTMAIEETTKAEHDFGDAMGQGINSVDNYINALHRWQSFADAFNQSHIDLATSMFKFDSQKFTKEFIKSLPNSLEKKMKLDLKFTSKSAAMEQSIQDRLHEIFEAINAGQGGGFKIRVGFDEKDVRTTAKETVQQLDDEFKGHWDQASPGLKKFRDELKKALDRSASDSEIAEILKKHIKDAPPIPVFVVNENNQFTGDLQTQADKNPINVPVQFTGFEGGGFSSDFLDVGEKNKKNKKKNVSTTSLNMPKGAIGVDEFGNWVDRNGNVVGQYGANINTKSGQGNFQGGAYGTPNQVMKPFPNLISMGNNVVAANPLDIMARQIDQITKNLSTFARAIVTVTKDMSMYARSVVTTTKDHNLLARTIAQLTSNNNLFARTVAQMIKNNNIYAQTVVQITEDHNILAKTQVQLTKNNNTYAKTVVQVTKDHNVLAKTQVQLTKNNNTLAKTIVQVGKDFGKSADDAKDFAKSLIAVAAAAKKAASAIKSIPSGGLEAAQTGMHKRLEHDTLILAHQGERVDIGPGSSSIAGGTGGGGMSGMLVVNLHNVNADREIIRTYKRELGKNQFVFGPS